MYLALVLSFALVGFAIAEPVPSTLSGGPKHILQPSRGGSKNVIRGLLDGSRISSRQANGCDIGYDVCDVNYCCLLLDTCCTGGGCCALGWYCDTVDGILGCCEDGEVCTETSNQCTESGYSPCTNDTYCCPTGDTCYRDSSGNANCASGSGGGGGVSSSISISIGLSSVPPVNNHTSQITSATGAGPGTNDVLPTSSPPAITVVSNTQTNLDSNVPTTTSTNNGNSFGGLNSSGMRTWGDLSGLTVLPILGFAAALYL